MKVLFPLLFSFFSLSISAQVAVFSKKNEEALDKFKKTETIFVFSDTYSKDLCEDILKKAWTVTPYKILSYKEFQDFNVLDEKYSFASYKVKVVLKDNGMAQLLSSFDFYVLDTEAIKKDLGKIKSKKGKEKSRRIFDKYRKRVAGIALHENLDFVKDVFPDFRYRKAFNELDGREDEILDHVYTKNPFLNARPGFFLNYLQQVNQYLINESNAYGKKDIFYVNDLRELAQDTLYVPRTILDRRLEALRRNDLDIEKIFSNYEYVYKVLPSDEISNRILNGEEFHYLMFCKYNTIVKYINVVNSNTGKLVYWYKDVDISHLKKKDLKTLNNAINKTSKEK